MHLFRADCDSQRFFPGLLAWIVCKKVHQQLAGLNASSFGKRILFDYLAKIFSRTKHYSWPKLEILFDCILYAFSQFSQVRFLAVEYNVTALDVGLRVFQFQRDTERPERVHLDQVAAADVHAAEHTDDDWHSERV